MLPAPPRGVEGHRRRLTPARSTPSAAARHRTTFEAIGVAPLESLHPEGPVSTDKTDKTVKKVSSETSPKGPMGQKYLASGKSVSMRLWEHEASDADKQESRRDYETVGYVLAGRAELELEGQTIVLEPGDCWLVPAGTAHRYRILEEFSAVEATSPPAEVHGRDEP